MNISDKEILNLIGEEEKNKILLKIKQIDEKIFLFNIEPPDSLDKKINSLGIHTKILEKRKILYKKIVVFILIFIFSGSLVCISNPNIVSAVKKVVMQIISFQTKESLEVNLYKGDDILNKLEFYVPNGFKKADYIDDFNTQKVIYKNTENQFIKISIYSDNFLLSLDNENGQQYEDIKINDYIGKIIIENDIITILFFDNFSLLQVESNLPKEKVLTVAKSININYEK